MFSTFSCVLLILTVLEVRFFKLSWSNFNTDFAFGSRSHNPYPFYLGHQHTVRGRGRDSLQCVYSHTTGLCLSVYCCRRKVHRPHGSQQGWNWELQTGRPVFYFNMILILTFMVLWCEERQSFHVLKRTTELGSGLLKHALGGNQYSHAGIELTVSGWHTNWAGHPDISLVCFHLGH